MTTTYQQDPASFNFDDWARLAKSDPEAFERKRRETLEAVIDNAPAAMQTRLRGLQWRVDMERSRAKSANSSCVEIYRMMWEKVYGEGGLLDALDGLLSMQTGDDLRRQSDTAKPSKSADVVNFRLGTS
jgi:hypothetical protein